MKPIFIKTLLLLSAIVIASAFFINPIPQSQAYHNFTDNRLLLSIPNFWNFISNIPFVIFGLYGLYFCKNLLLKTPFKICAYIFFTGVSLTGIGSSYYHFSPNNTTLIWDRLPMTITFMSFFSLVLGVFINEKLAKTFLLPLLSVGIISILYWVVFDDLKMYLLVQFLPIFLLLLILIFSHQNKSYKHYFFKIFLFYAFAKITETFDDSIFRSTHEMISGHPLKHILASIAPLFLILFLNDFYK